MIPTLTRDGAQLVIRHGDTFLSLPYAQATRDGLCAISWMSMFMQSIGARRVQSDMPRRLLREALYGPTTARKKVRKAASLWPAQNDAHAWIGQSDERAGS